MNLRNKKLIIPAGIAAVALVVGGTVWAASGDELDGDTYDRATQAALAEVGDGTVTDTSAGDDRDDPAYEVEITRRDGSEVDVALDEDFAVVYVDDDRAENDGDQAGSARDGSSDDAAPTAGSSPRGDTDDRPLTGDVKSQAEAAAVKAVGSGEATASQQDDDRDGDRAIYDVDVRADDGTRWNVELDEKFAVVDKEIDD